MMIYKKLVRDRIPEIIEKTQKNFFYSVLSQEDYKKEIKNKFKEELKEYFDSNSDYEALEELADILELVRAAVKVHGYSYEELEEIRETKAKGRGGFEKRFFLIEVEDD